MNASVQPRPNVGFEGPPPSQQLKQLHGLAGMLLSDCFQSMDLIAHQGEIGDRVHARLLDTADISAKGAPAEDDALIGCGRSHGGSIVWPARCVNGGLP